MNILQRRRKAASSRGALTSGSSGGGDGAGFGHYPVSGGVDSFGVLCKAIDA
jgi:hypothetical protein